MNAKKFLSALTLSALFASTALAAGADDELSIMAAEQRRENPSDVETFEHNDPPPASTRQQPKVEPQKPEPQKVETQKPEPPKVQTPQPQVNPPSNTQSNARANNPSVGMPNPIVSYKTFEECVEELGYIPLYVPKRSGFTLNSISIIGGNVADLRYGRRWETEVNLMVRTYKRPVGEELRDISGVQGVKWRVDLSGDTPIYLARINENANAAAWSIGQYTFAAMTENLNFASFRTLVFEELADLSAHYFIEY